MKEQTQQLYFEQRGKEVALVRVDKNGEETELLMPPSAVLSMPKIVGEMIHEILAQHSQRSAVQPGNLPMVASPVTWVDLNVEPQTHEILLVMHDAYGNEIGYALPIELARHLAEWLPTLLAEAEAAAKNQKKH
jgi:hypothetical protein